MKTKEKAHIASVETRKTAELTKQVQQDNLKSRLGTLRHPLKKGAIKYLWLSTHKGRAQQESVTRYLLSAEKIRQRGALNSWCGC